MRVLGGIPAALAGAPKPIYDWVGGEGFFSFSLLSLQPTITVAGWMVRMLLRRSNMLTYLDLVRMSPAQLANADILEMNAACAAGLPGGESFDNPKARSSVDRLARSVKVYTRQRYTEFENRPSEYGNSKAVFRALCMVTVLQRDNGIMYCSGLMNAPNFFRDARNVFAHGALDGRGTCSSLPIVYLAVGRRLGYPLKLVGSKYHLFARWDDPGGERFNIECTSRGFVSHPDQRYVEWPEWTHPDEAMAHGWLQSKTRREELAFCLAARGHVLLENLRFHEAAEAYAYAHEMEPAHSLHQNCVEAALNRWENFLPRHRAEQFADIEIGPAQGDCFAALSTRVVERMSWLRQIDAAISAERRRRDLAEVEEQSRRKAEDAATAKIEFHYSWPPSE